MKRILSTAVLGLFASASALAADGYLTGDVNLRAGPDPGYPSVAMLSAGTEVAIQGCVDGWSWCDVAVGDNRGWVAGDFLQEEYQSTGASLCLSREGRQAHPGRSSRGVYSDLGHSCVGN